MKIIFRKIGLKINFIDSFKFLSTSLKKKMASYLDKDELKIICSKFSTLSDEEFELTCKSIFPYEYVDCVEKLQDTRLSSRE